MKIPSNVKIKSWIWNISPILSQSTAQAIYPNIYVPKWLYEHLKSKNSDPKREAVITHEQTHIKRQKEIGFIKWGFLYAFDSKFRLNEELIAIKEQLKYLKKKEIKISDEDIEKIACGLSSYLYLWMISYENAKRELKKLS